MKAIGQKWEFGQTKNKHLFLISIAITCVASIMYTINEVNACYPPIKNLDGPFHQLVACEKMSLSTNNISVISNLSGFKRLKVLTLGRNLIKNLHGIESVGDTLESLWISYNQIDRLKPIRSLQKLKVK